MSILRRPAGVLTALAALVALASPACSSAAGSLGEVGTYTEGGAGGFGSGDDASAGVHASVTPAAQAICSGQCVDLSATVTGGSAPYAYAWTGGGQTGSLASLHACPTATTTYTVTATDSSGRAGELAQAAAKGSASATVTVGATCADASAADAGGGPPAQIAHEVCSIEWPTVAAPVSLVQGNYQSVTAAADAAGNILVAVAYNGTVTANGQTFTAQGTSDALVVKLDPQCHVLWTKDFGAVGGDVLASSITSDAALNVFVGGNFDGNVDFGAGPPPGGGSFYYRGFVVALTPSGAPRWVGGEYAGSFLAGLATDGQGDVAFESNDSAVDAGANATLEGVVTLNAAGALVREVDNRTLGGFADQGPLPNLGMNRAGAVVVTAQGDSMGTDDSEVGAAAEMAPDGTPLWSLQLPAPPAPAQFGPATLSAVNAAIDPAGDAFLLGAWQWVGTDSSSSLLQPASVTRISADGQVLWTRTTTDLVLPPAAFPAGGAFALDGADDTFVGGDLTGSATFGALGTVTSAGMTDAAFAVLDSSGALRSAGRWSAGPNNGTVLFSIAIDGSDVVLAGVTSSATVTSFYVARLGW
jgi:hypothetical protein